MPDSGAILALDQGTTSSRAIAYAADASTFGVRLGEGRRELPIAYPRPGWVELDPREIWRTQRESAEEAIARAGVAGRDVHGIGVTNQRETVMIWERSTGTPVGPAIVWQDRRTAPRTDELRRQGREPWLLERTGLVCDPYFSASKLEWLLDHLDGARARAERGELAAGTVDCWLLWNLTEGRVHATDCSNASRTQLWNLTTQSWDEELCRLFRVPPEVLPEVRPSAGVFGTCSLFGGEIPIVSLVGDQQAALAGQGCAAAGESKTTYGTGCFLLVQAGAAHPVSGSRLLTTAAWRIANEPLHFALEGSVFMGGALIQWLRDGLGVIAEAREVGPLAESVADAAGVVLVPAFTGLGAPHWDAEARGTVFGLTRGAGRAHLARAALEAIAHQVADVIEAANRDLVAAGDRPVQSMRVDGGAAACDELMRLQAELLGVPIERPTDLETTARGAAALAMIALGRASDLASLREPDSQVVRFDPTRDERWRADERERWRSAIELCRKWKGQ